MAQKRLLTEREVARIDKLADALCRLREYYYEDDNAKKTKNTPLQIEENGTVYDCISCALASLDIILQEYSPNFNS